jgi:dipeptidyl-peptidase 9
LLWERKRCVAWGITQFELHPQSGKFVFPAASSLFSCIDNGGGHASPAAAAGCVSGSGGPLFPSELKTVSCQGARLNAAICPNNPDLVAFVAHGDLWLTHAVTGQEARLTFSHRGHESLADDPMTAGLPSYIMQEEFNRFTGFWWRPTVTDCA